MMETINEVRDDFKPHVPRIEKITIPKDMIGAVIGPGGKVIQDIQEKTGTTITITQEGDTGIVDIFAEDKAAIDEALRMVNGITEVPEVGKVYKGKIKSIGVSNFWQEHFDALFKTANVKPAVNQIEFHPGYWQPELTAFCKKHDIVLEAWSPLARGRVFDNETLQ